MGENTIEVGSVVAAKTADGRWLRKRADSAVVPGHSFPVVWLSWEDDDPAEASPWPAGAVVPLLKAPEQPLGRAEYKASIESSPDA